MVTTGATSDRKANRLTWAGLALVVPSTAFWASLLLAGLLHNEAISEPFMQLVDLFDVWFVVGVLLLMPLAGGILAAVGFRRHHMPLGIVVMLLGFGAAAFNILMQTAPPPAN
jgi:hypothetical protein